MSARVSVIVRTKDRPVLLARALADISAQTYRDWHVVIVNDGGDRATLEGIVAEAGDRGRTTVIDSTPPRGRCRAANDGIRASNGEFVVLHDDDDHWHPRFLDETVAHLDAHSDEVGVMTSTAIVYETWDGARWRETERVPFWEGMQRISLVELLEINHAVPISFLYRRSLHDEVGWYDVTLDAVEDWEFYLRIVPRFAVGFIPGQPLAFWTQRLTATGADANSMVGLGDLHERDDAIVRDRALAEWITHNGIGLPLYLAHLEKRIADQVVDRLRIAVGEQIDAHQPLWRRLRDIRRRFRGRGSS